MLNCSVVILNWNGKSLLEKFLPKVVSYSGSLSCEVVVVDNGSTDGSVQWVAENMADVKIISFDKNYGFTGGYNKAIAELDSRYIAILNSDVEIKEQWLQPLIDILDNDEGIAAVMPKILSQTSPNNFEYAGACGGFIDKYNFPFCRGRIMSTIELDNGQYDTAREIFWTTGAAMLIRRDLFLNCGGFDEDFFAHMEEIDICWRLQNMGYKIMVEPQSRVYHVGGATLSYQSTRKLFLNFRNSLFAIHKNTLTSNYKRIIFGRMIIDGMLAMIYLLCLKPKRFITVIKAHNAYRSEKITLDEKRKRNIKMGCKSTSNSNIYPKSIIWEYLFGKKTFTKLKF